MPLYTVRQLHKTLCLLARGNPAQGSYVSAVTFFNADVIEAKQMFPHDPLLASLILADDECPIGDLLVRTGQLFACLQEHARHGGRSELTAREHTAWKKSPLRQAHVHLVAEEDQ
mgnify:FL=1